MVEMACQGAAVVSVLGCPGGIVPAPDADGDVLLDFIEQVENAADFSRGGGVARDAITIPEGRFADPTVIEDGELDFNIPPEGSVEVDDASDVSVGVDEDILTPNVHVEQTWGDFMVKMGGVVGEKPAHETGFCRCVASASNHIIQEQVPHCAEGG